jgi:cell division protein ZapA
MGEVSIKIKIAEREYPMRVEASEESVIRASAKMVDEKLKTYKEQFGINDKQDLLAMVAFDCMIQQMRADDIDAGLDSKVSDKVTALDLIIGGALND